MHLLVVWYLVNLQDARYNNKDNVLLCLIETNKFIIVFQFYNIRACPLQKKNFTRKIQKNLQCFYGEQPEGLPARAKLTMTFFAPQCCQLPKKGTEYS